MRAWLAALTLALLVAGAHARTEPRQAVEPDAGYAVGNGPHDLFRLPAGYSENLVVVEDTPSSSADNILELPGRDPARVRVEADTGGELNLYWADQRAGVIIRDEFLSVPGHRLGVQRIRFDGGLTWTQGELAHRLGVNRRKLALTPAETARADPMTTARFALGRGVADTFRMHASDHNLTVLEIASGPHPRNQIVFDPPLDSKTAELFDDHGDVTVSWYGSAAARLTIRGALVSHSGSRYGLQRLRFADGVTWTDRDLSLRLRSPAPARDVARGWIYGGTGPERLDTRGLAHGVIGRGGGDVIVYRRGYGDLNIDEADRSLHPHNRIALGPGIAPANVSVRREGDQLLLDVGGGAAMPRSVITLRGEFAHPANVTRGIQDLSFADGERWNYAALVARIARTSPHNQHPEGDDGPNVFHLTADTVDVNGHGGGDSFLLETKASGPRIKEADRRPHQPDRLFMPAGVHPTDVMPLRDRDSLFLEYVQNPDERDVRLSQGVMLVNQFVTERGVDQGVQEVVFADGVRWSAAELRRRTDAQPLDHDAYDQKVRRQAAALRERAAAAANDPARFRRFTAELRAGMTALGIDRLTQNALLSPGFLDMTEEPCTSVEAPPQWRDVRTLARWRDGLRMLAATLARRYPPDKGEMRDLCDLGPCPPPARSEMIDDTVEALPRAIHINLRAEAASAPAATSPRRFVGPLRIAASGDPAMDAAIRKALAMLPAGLSDRESFPAARSHANVLIVSLGGLGLPPGGGRNYVAQAARWRATRQARFPWLYVDVPVGENPLYAFAAARGSTVEARIAGGSVNNAPLIGVDTQGLITRAACVSGRSAYEIAECLGIATLTPRAVRSTLGSGKRNACLSLTRASRARVECIGVALVLLAGAAYALLKLGRRR